VPGPTSNVCIPTFGQADATPPISIHSIKVTEGGTLIIIGSGTAGASFSVATSLGDSLCQSAMLRSTALLVTQ
jgi:hypothetical protein